MTDKKALDAQCAHLRVRYRTQEQGSGLVSGHWECDDCFTEFAPIAALTEHERVFTALATCLAHLRKHGMVDDSVEGELRLTDATTYACECGYKNPTMGFHNGCRKCASLCAKEITNVPTGVTPTDKLVDDFAAALKDKLNKAREKYSYHGESWKESHLVDAMRCEMYKHLKKGDPRDVAAYCAFLWFHNASTYDGSNIVELQESPNV